MLRKRILSALLFVVLFLSLQAQNLKGRVIDATTNEPVPFANLVLLNRADSTFVSGAVTNDHGEYRLEIADNNQPLMLKVSYLGYQTQYLQVPGDNTDVIRLQGASKELGEVVVSARRVVHRMENSGISTDIQSTPLREIGTALEVLGQLPFVFRDGDAISVIGKGTPLIYINNRLVRDMDELKQLRSEQIKKVLVINNPGAEYDSTVSAVIRITLVKGQGEGWSGTSNATGTLHRRHDYRLQQTLNYRIGAWDFFGGMTYLQGNNLERSTFNQETAKSGTNGTEKWGSTFNISLDNAYRGLTANGGFNRTFGKDGSFGVRYDYDRSMPSNGGVAADGTIYTIKNGLESSPSDFTSNWRMGGDDFTHYVNAYLETKPASWLEAKIDADYAHGNTGTWQFVQTEQGQSTDDIDTRSTSKYDLYAAKATLKSPVWGSTLTYGGEYSYTNTRQEFLVPDPGNSILVPNSNTARQNLVAGFVSYAKQFGKWSVDAGIRYEHVLFDYIDNEGKRADEGRTYNNVFPSAGLSYSGEALQLMLGYRNTVSRPSYRQLSTTLQYDTPYLYEGGNPYLLPSYTDAISLQAMWKQFIFSAQYSMTKDPVLWDLYTAPTDDQILIIMNENLPDQQALNISLSYNAKLWKWWTAVPEVIFYKEYATYKGESYNRPFFRLSLRNIFKLPWNIQGGLDGYYFTRGHQSMNLIEPRFIARARLSKAFLNNQLRINLSGDDIFHTALPKNIMQQGTSKLSQYRDVNSTRLTLSVSYSFNATRSKYKGEAATEEFNRL